MLFGVSKPLAWLHGEVKTPPFSARARAEAGYLLRLLQEGERLGLPESRPMPRIGSNCHELRVVDENCRGGMMRAAKQKRLEQAGWRVGKVAEFLDLTDVEAQFVEIKVALAQLLRATRTRRRLTQFELAEKIGSSQSRVAKLEAGDPSVSVDLLVRSLLAAGAKPAEFAKAVSTKRR